MSWEVFSAYRNMVGDASWKPKKNESQWRTGKLMKKWKNRWRTRKQIKNGESPWFMKSGKANEEQESRWRTV